MGTDQVLIVKVNNYLFKIYDLVVSKNMILVNFQWLIYYKKILIFNFFYTSFYLFLTIRWNLLSNIIKFGYEWITTVTLAFAFSQPHQLSMVLSYKLYIASGVFLYCEPVRISYLFHCASTIWLSELFNLIVIVIYMNSIINLWNGYLIFVYFVPSLSYPTGRHYTVVVIHLRSWCRDSNRKKKKN